MFGKTNSSNKMKKKDSFLLSISPIFNFAKDGALVGLYSLLVEDAEPTVPPIVRNIDLQKLLRARIRNLLS